MPEIPPIRPSQVLHQPQGEPPRSTNKQFCTRMAFSLKSIQTDFQTLATHDVTQKYLQGFAKNVQQVEKDYRMAEHNPQYKASYQGIYGPFQNDVLNNPQLSSQSISLKDAADEFSKNPKPLHEFMAQPKKDPSQISYVYNATETSRLVFLSLKDVQ